MAQDVQKMVVAAMIVREDGRILLQQKRNPQIPASDGKWEMPGGKVDFGETPEDALRRECREEIGCEVALGRMLPTVQSRIWETSDGGRIHSFVACYLAVLASGTPVSHDPKVGEVRWCTQGEAVALDLLPGVRDFILQGSQAAA